MTPTRIVVRELRDSGLTPPEIARQLELAPPTVAYHLARLASSAGEPVAAEMPTDQRAAKRAVTRTLVAELLSQGVPRAEIARRLGLSKPTVSYHARRLDQPIDDRCSRRYDWEAIQQYYDAGHSVRDCITAFGFSSASWHEAVKRGVIVARVAGMPIDQLLVDGTYRGRFHLKLRLLREGLKQAQCERCGVAEWHGRPLTLSLHHVNGRRNDNRLENLELLCPNCHSQTDNYAGRNGRAAERPAT